MNRQFLLVLLLCDVGLCFVALPARFAAPIALLSCVLLIRWVPRVGLRSDNAQRSATELAMPLVLDVMALGLDAGVSWDRSVNLAADCVDGALRVEMATAGGRLALGAASHEVWHGTFALNTVGHVVDRSFRSGAAVSVLLQQQADAMRAMARMHRLERVRRLETSILLPLTGLGIPGFVVLGVLPMIVSTFQQLGIPGLSTGGS